MFPPAYDELLERLNGTSLPQAVDFFIAHGRGMIAGATTRQVYTTYLEHLHRRGVGSFIFRMTVSFTMFVLILALSALALLYGFAWHNQPARGARKHD